MALYEEIKDLDNPEKIEKITTTLVGLKSINGTKGEVDIANFIKAFLYHIPYFSNHPEYVWEQKLENDELGRKNIFALIMGPSDKTVIYHSHSDTVGIEDFGAQKENAFNPEKIKAFFSTYEENVEIQQAALSGDWMFGRGSVDMKSGIAVHLTNILHFSKHLEELTGNVLLMINPVEENEHTGVICSISELNRLKKEKELDYVMAINNDFCTPLYDGDPNRYIHTGAVGKLLPCFFIYGREAHVGETLTGVDPTHISAEINRRINNNMELAENIKDELVLPPSCLFQRDNKDFYNVQTALTSYLYFNYFIYEDNPKSVMEKLLNIAKESCIEVESKLFEQYSEFLNITGLPSSKISWKTEVDSYSELINELSQKGIDTESISRKVVDQNSNLEPRMLCFKIIEELLKQDPEKKPRVIVFFAPPYCPHNYLNIKNEKERKKYEVIDRVLKETEIETGEKFSMKKFFPYLSDSSYLSLHDTDEEINSLVKNFPEWDKIYPVPVNGIRQLNIPSINMGVYGKDAHQWSERVYKPYTFHILPKLIRQVTKEMLNEEDHNE
ncbi:M20/M25/M40 family metallo-hydrolase [Halalkalibacter okhensis]|uniref:Peptidase M20 n=1 Tax=Halalkalibacter okhensis TaxID=333138 RepID=A0A0B0IAD2_9BACI|nr:M20/M25/M40 family metallo-hydrolase [Halalkalibacter okhensis]KHF39508.1 peptidase M20 [Halalkalibacter okhensis]